MIRRLMSPLVQACRYSHIRSICQLCLYTVPGSTVATTCFTKGASEFLAFLLSVIDL
jgi:hypothetical protein